MHKSTISLNRNSGRALRAMRAILAGGLLAGTVDVGAAALISMLDPRIILRFIAGGLLGKTALHGDWPVLLLGLLLQWGMSMLIAGVFVLAALRMRGLISRPIVAGLAYGVIVFAVMNYLVMPFSAWGHVNHFSPVKFVENLAAMLLFGVIIALVTRQSLSNPTCQIAAR